MSLKSLVRMSPLAAAVLVSGALLFAARGGKASEDYAERASSIVGTWRVRVTLVNCQTGQPVGTSFPAFLTFGRGGTLTETTSANFFPAVRSPGHGAWTSEGGGSYGATSSAFLTRDGALFRTQTITQEIVLDGGSDSFTSTATTEFFDPSGALVMKGCANAVGQRYR